MSKHRLSLPSLPPSKRLHSISSAHNHRAQVTFDTALFDELILVIFAHLSWVDLCKVQATNKNWARLASDNQLWKTLYLSEYGRARLRGARGFIGRNDGREVRPLPGRAKVEDGNVKDWKWMFRISSNWRTGRCSVEQLSEATGRPLTLSFDQRDSFPEQTHILLAGNLTIIASSVASAHPPICLRSTSGITHTLFSGSPTYSVSTQITALALDQSPPSSLSSCLHLASFLSTGEFTIFTINHTNPSSSSRKLTYVPLVRNARTSPIIQAVYHHPLLITLSRAFHLSLYNLSGNTVLHTQTLSSFTSYPPTSLVLSTPSPTTYKLVLAHAVPVYPAHWSVGATELILSGPESSTGDIPLTVLATRTTRTFDVPQGWINEQKLRSMREQWGRKVERVADIQTDGKWVVLAPGNATGTTTISRYPPSPSPSSSTSSSSSRTSTPASSPTQMSRITSMYSPTHLQLYRLHLPTSSSFTASPKLTFVRTLHGQTGYISALALADGRCVSLSTNGSIWVWDLEGGTGAEVASAGVNDRGLEYNYDEEESEENDALDTDLRGTVVFDERKIISAGVGGVQVRRFDV